MTQPTALYLAEVIDSDADSKAHHRAAAYELRRLYQFAKDQIETIDLLRSALAQQAEPTGYRCELCGMANMHEVDALLAELERLRSQVARLRDMARG